MTKKFTLILSLAIIGFYLIAEHKAHLYGASSYIFFAVFLLMHLGMHAGHGGHSGGKKGGHH